MPIYTYECKGCGRTVVLLTNYDEKSPECKKCGTTMTKLIGGVKLNFKGDWNDKKEEQNKKDSNIQDKG